MKIEFQNKEVNVKENISIVDALTLVKNVAGTVVDLDKGTYTPLFYDVSLIGFFIETYTDLEKPNINDIFDNLDEYTIFIKNITNDLSFNTSQYFGIKNCIDKEIEFKKQQLLNPLGQLIGNINTIVKNMDESLDFNMVTTLLPKLAELGKLNEKAIVDALDKAKLLKTPQDHKKPTTRKKKEDTPKEVNKWI